MVDEAAEIHCKCSALACGEAEYKRPHKQWDMEFADSFDNTEFFGVLYEELGRE